MQFQHTSCFSRLFSASVINFFIGIRFIYNTSGLLFASDNRLCQSISLQTLAPTIHGYTLLFRETKPKRVIRLRFLTRLQKSLMAGPFCIRTSVCLRKHKTYKNDTLGAIIFGVIWKSELEIKIQRPLCLSVILRKNAEAILKFRSKKGYETESKSPSRLMDDRMDKWVAG